MKLYALDPIDNPAALAKLAAAGIELDADAHADIQWVRLRRVTARMLDFMPDLKYLCCPCTGLDHIDTAECRRRGIKVIGLQGLPGLREVRATVELTIGLILALTRRIPWAAKHVQGGGWNRYPFLGTDLYRKQAGIVGYGRIGQGVYGLLSGFCMEIAYHDPKVSGSMQFTHLLEFADILTVHAALTPLTRGMFGPAEFARMRSGAFFVNTARGAIVQADALLDALESGHLGGAALDVVDGEPELSPRLVDAVGRLPNLIVTPHIGGCTRESMAATEMMVVDALLAEIGNG